MRCLAGRAWPWLCGAKGVAEFHFTIICNCSAADSNISLQRRGPADSTKRHSSLITLQNIIYVINSKLHHSLNCNNKSFFSYVSFSSSYPMPVYYNICLYKDCFQVEDQVGGCISVQCSKAILTLHPNQGFKKANPIY